MALYREDLEQFRCDVPDCDESAHTDEIYLHPRCHMESPTWVHYRADVLTIECAKCGRIVATVVIASRAHEAREPGSEPDVEDDDERCP